MDLAERMTNAREHYLLRYRRWIAERKRAVPKAVPEVLFLMNAKSPVPEKYRLYRADLVEVREGKSEFAEMNTEPDAQFNPETYKATDSLRVVLHPLVWNGCEFRFAAPPPPWPSVDAWLEEWFDEHESKPADEDGLAGVLHNMTQPSNNAEFRTFSVDFGSAPVDAFFKLLEALASTGVREVAVGSFHLLADQG